MHGSIRNTTFKKYVAIALSLLLGQPAFTQSAQNQQMAFEGSLTDNSGNPINLAGASLRFYILVSGCYLYGESSTVAGDSQGNILHRFGSGSVLAGSPNTFSQNLFFGNVSGTTLFAGNNCSATSTDTRLAQVYYPTSNITATITLGTIPYAQNATMLAGKSVSGFVQTSTDTNTVFTAGSNGQYLTKSASGLTWSTLSLTSGQITTALGYTPSSGAATVTSSSVISALGYTPSSGAAIVTSASVITALGYTPSSGAATVTSASVITAMGYTPANSATLTTYSVKANNLSDLVSATAARTNLGLGVLSTKAFVDLGTADASGTLAVARLPSFIGDVVTSVGSAATTVQAIRGISVSTTAPTSGQALVYNGSAWTPVTIPTSFTAIGTVTNVSSANSDISVSSSTSTPVLTLNVGVGANQIIRLDGTSRLPAVDASLLTNFNANQLITGTVSAARLPAFTGDVTTSTGSSTTTVSALRGITVSATAPTNGQVLKYNGSVWAPAIDATSAGVSYTVGTTSGTLAAGDDSRIVGALQKANNLSDLISSATARTNLGLSTLATKTSINLTTDVSGVLPVANGGSPWTQSVSGVYTFSNIGIGVSTPTARLHIASGTSTLAALKIASGTLLSTPAAGAIESDGANLYFTDGSNIRRVLNTSVAAVSGPAQTSIDNASTINSDTNITLYPLGGSVIVSSTLASTDANTAALVVKGGIGVNGHGYFTGNLYSAGGINASGTIAATNFSATGTIKTNGLITTTGNITASGSIATSGSITALGNIFAGSLIAPTIYGSSVPSGSLFLESTSDTTKGNIVLGASGGAIGIGAAPQLSSNRFEIKSKGIGTASTSATLVLRTASGPAIIVNYEDTNNNFATRYYDALGQPRIMLAASATNYINNNFVVGDIVEIPGNNKLSVNGNTAMSGNLAVSKTLILGGATSSTAPVAFAVSTVTSAPLAGAFEYDGTDFLFTNTALQRRRVAGGSVSGTIDNTNKLSYSMGALTLEGTTTSVNPAVIINNNGVGTVALQVNQNMIVSGSIKLAGEGLDSATTCTAGDDGKQRYNKTLKTMEYCDGTYWQGIQGVTNCPTSGGVSFTLVGKAGTRDAFCMTASNLPDATYFNAVDQCAATTSYTSAPSRICSETELNLACKSYSTLLETKLPGFGTGTLKYWIPATDTAYALDYTVSTGVSCSVSNTATATARGSGTINSYRCCYQ